MSASSELLVPKSRADGIAALIGTIVGVTFLVLAVCNLLHRVAVVPSALWIALIALMVLGKIRQSGWRGFGLAVLGAFSRKQVLLVSATGESTTVGIGFRLFRANMIEQRIPAGDLVAIRCSSGQASELAGRDMNDWSVALWYRHRDPAREARERQFGLRRPGEAPIIIGPPRARAVTEALGQRVASFLEESGVSVAPQPP